jgi:ArsR family transcriptional regulator
VHTPLPNRLAEIFAALADPTRLRLLNLIAEREICVCYLVDVLGQPQPKISRHLAYLRKTALVAARREGKWMHYRLCQPADPASAAILAEVLRALQGDGRMQLEKAQLERSCCAPQALIMPGGAE